MIFDFPMLARLCKDAYSRDDLKISGGTQGIIARANGFNIIAFRGTEFDFADILRDIRILPWWSHELNRFVHAGFLKAARQALPVAEELSGPLILTGHSLGGAVARVVGALLNRPDTHVITFGEPRSIIGTLPEIQRRNSARFINGKDIVPRHPWPLWGYRHQGPSLHIGENPSSFRSHRIDNYIKNM